MEAFAQSVSMMHTRPELFYAHQPKAAVYLSSIFGADAGRNSGDSQGGSTKDTGRLLRESGEPLRHERTKAGAEENITNALDTIQKRMGELLQNEDVAYGMQTRRYSLESTLDLLDSKIKETRDEHFKNALKRYNFEGPVEARFGEKGWVYEVPLSGEQRGFDSPLINEYTGRFDTAKDAREALIDFYVSESTPDWQLRRYSLESTRIHEDLGREE